MPLSSGVKLSVTGMLSEGTVVTDPTHTVQAIQAVTLPDGSTAFIQQPKGETLMFWFWCSGICQNIKNATVEFDGNVSSLLK